MQKAVFQSIVEEIIRKPGHYMEKIHLNPSSWSRDCYNITEENSRVWKDFMYKIQKPKS